MKSKDYAKTGTYYLVGNLFNKGIAFLTIIIYTRILTAYDYGIINTFSLKFNVSKSIFVLIFIQVSLYLQEICPKMNAEILSEEM